MKAVTYDQFGNSSTLKLRDYPTPEPRENEVLIKIENTSVNPVDWKIREGLLKERMPHKFPIIPGWDAAGKIAKVGKNVKDYKVGDEVYAYTRKDTIQDGTYAEYIAVPADFVAIKPKKATFAQAAALPLVALTAWQALFDVAKLKKGQTVFIQAGSGGVGSLAIQFAKYAGCKVYTSASQNNFDYVKKFNPDKIIDYKNENFVDVIQKENPDGIDVVFDMQGGDTLKNGAKIVKKGGAIVSIIQPLDKALADKYGIQGLYCFVRPSGEQLKEIARLIDQGKIQLPHTEEMSIKDAAIAQDKNREGHVRGKLVLKINP